MTYTLDDIYSQLNEIKLMMAENDSSGWEDKKAEGLYASAIGKGAKAGGSRIVNLINNINAALEYTKSNLKGIYGHVQHMIEPWAKADEAASKYAKTIAMTADGMRKLRKTAIENAVSQKIGIYYNVSTDELLKIQNDYAKAVGRGIRVDDTQQENLAAMHAVMNGKEIELAAAFENFGVSLNGVADHAGKMFADASKNGLSFEKYSDNVAKNIKIAQNYTFKNGLKGLESMAKKATAIKLDMGQVASFAEKVSTIEGAIDVASKLQVLGGSFAGIASSKYCSMYCLKDLNSSLDNLVVDGRLPISPLLIIASCLSAELWVSAIGRTRKYVLSLSSPLLLPDATNSSSTSISGEYGSWLATISTLKRIALSGRAAYR
jgi:hypothetical protein